MTVVPPPTAPMHTLASRWIDRLLEHPVVFNTNQVVLDGGKTRHIRRFLDSLEYESMVDIGCGTGNWAGLARGRYLGVDTSEAFVAASQKRYAGDTEKEFIRADAVTTDLPGEYDLGILISVLHHLSDAEAGQLFTRLADRVAFLFILDLYPIPENPVSQWLYRIDRGDYIREPDAQRQLILSTGRFSLTKEGDFYSWNRLYRHTLFQFSVTGKTMTSAGP